MQMLGWRYSLVVKCLPSVCEALGSIPRKEKRQVVDADRLGLDSEFPFPSWALRTCTGYTLN